MKETKYEADSLLQNALNAIKSGDQEKAEQAVKYLWNAVKIQHDGLLTQMSLVLNYVAEQKGEEGVNEVYRYIADNIWAGTAERFKKGELTYDVYKNFLRMGYQSHYSAFTEEEYDDHTTFCIEDCGVCGKMRKDKNLDSQEGGALNFGTIKEKHDWCFNETGMPYFCVHAPYIFSKVGKENGYNNMSFEWGSQFEENPKPCRTTIYKEPQE